MLSSLIQRRWTAMLMLAASTLFVSACDDDDDSPNLPQQNLLELASSDNRFDILEAAVVRSTSDGDQTVASALQGNQQLTVFAPTDDAFIAYVSDLTGSPVTEEQALTAINQLDPADLRAILAYHVLGQRFEASQLPENGAENTLAATADGGRVFIRRSGDIVRVNDTEVILANVSATNGIIHAIDGVLVPPATDITNLAVGNDDLDVLVAALTKANLANTFTTDGPFTVFAPTDAAFVSFLGVANEAAAISAINAFTADQINNTLIPVLQAHVLADNLVVYAADVPGSATAVNTLNANVPVTVQSAGGGVTVTGEDATPSNVVAANVQATNGVVHVIDRVIRVE